MFAVYDAQATLTQVNLLVFLATATNYITL